MISSRGTLLVLQNKRFPDFFLLFNDQFWSLGLKAHPPLRACLSVSREKERIKGVCGKKAFGARILRPGIDSARCHFPPSCSSRRWAFDGSVSSGTSL